MPRGWSSRSTSSWKPATIGFPPRASPSLQRRGRAVRGHRRPRAAGSSPPLPMGLPPSPCVLQWGDLSRARGGGVGVGSGACHEPGGGQWDRAQLGHLGLSIHAFLEEKPTFLGCGDTGDARATQGGICQVGLVPGFKSGDQLEMALGAEVAGGAGPRGQTQGEWYGSESSSGVVVPYPGMQGTWGHRCRVPPHES